MLRAILLTACVLALQPALSAQGRSFPAKEATRGRSLPGASSNLPMPVAPVALGSQLVGGSDNCATPDVIVGDGTYAFDNTSATTGAEGQNQAACNQVGGGTAIVSDVWFAWTATTTGLARINTCGLTSIDTKIAVYNGAGCPTSAVLACNDDACAGFQSTVTFNAVAGNVYSIQLGLYPGTQPPATPGAGVFQITTSVPQIGPDNCATPTVISGDGTFSFDNTNATTGAEGQTQALCDLVGAGTPILQDVWFRWTAATTGTAIITTCGYTGIDTKLAFYAGAGCPTTNALACNDDACAGFQSTLTVPVQAGQTYMLQLGLYPGTIPVATAGAGLFNIVTRIPPPNDNCANSQNISGLAFVPYDSAPATTGAQGQNNALCAEPAGAGVIKDLWYSWTAPSTATYRISSCGFSVNDTKFAVYQGQGCPTGQAISCNDDDCNTQARAMFSATAGQRYTFQIGLWPAAPASGPSAFVVELVPPAPANDECANATAIAGPGPHAFDTSLCFTGTQGQAEAACLFFNQTAIRNDQWFTWTAGATGPATLTTCGGLLGSPSDDTKVAVYLGAGCPTGPAIACNEDDGGCSATGFPSTVTWNAVCGQQYTIQLGRYPLEINSVLGTFTIAENGQPCVVATAFCFGDGSGAPCPCGNLGAAGHGCANSVVASGARSDATGVASLAADSVVLSTQGTPNSGVLYFQGTAQVGGGLGSAFGDGLRCAGGSVLRLGTKIAVGGQSAYPAAGEQSITVRGQVTAPGTRNYQAWYRNSAAFCTPSGFNLGNGLEIVWGP
jgi:hypothetical protein